MRTNTLPMLARIRPDERDAAVGRALSRTSGTEADLAAQKLSRLAVPRANPRGFSRFDLSACGYLRRRYLFRMM